MAELASKVVTQALEMWALMGLGKCPEKITPEIGLAWLLPLRSAGVTAEEWGWVCSYIPVEPGRRFWPAVPEVIDLIRERRRRQLGQLEMIGVHRDGVLAIEVRDPSTQKAISTEAGRERVPLPDLSKLRSKVVR